MQPSMISLIGGMLMVQGGIEPSRPRPTESVGKLKANPEQFGIASPAQRNATLSGRRGKIPRRKRKALNAKQGR